MGEEGGKEAHRQSNDCAAPVSGYACKLRNNLVCSMALGFRVVGTCAVGSYVTRHNQGAAATGLSVVPLGLNF